MTYYYKKQVDLSFYDAVERAKYVLGEQGFGVLMELNVSETLNNKIGVELDNYIILGACSPKHAYEAIKAEIDIGLLLPCNVVVYQTDNRVYVSAIKPSIAMSVVDKPELTHIAVEIEERLKTVIDAI